MAADAAQAAPPFRFSRLGPRGTALGEANRKKLAKAMTKGGGGAGSIPAGYTYLGQFVDHDLTFDKTAVMLGQNVSPAQLLQGRSPSLDLDSLYGAGPSDPASAAFYKDDRHLKMGKTVAIDPDPAMDGHDLPRGAGTTAAQKRKAVIPDKRNDENLAVAQTHLAMIRFHNRVVDTLPSGTPAAQRFARARESVVKHYQWMLRHDFLPRICEASVVDDVFTNGRKALALHADPTDVPTMPIEFSVAAFRLGHAMIRESYNWNKRFDHGAGALFFLFDFSATSGSLGGFKRLPSNWIADFRRLYDFGEAGRADLTVPAGKFNRAMRIDTTLADPLKALPAGSFGGPGPTRPRSGRTSRSATSRARRWSSWRRASRWSRSSRARACGCARSPPRRSATGTAARRWPRSRPPSAPGWSRAPRCGSTSCARPSSTTAASRAPARASWPRRSTARWRGASTRSCATRRSARRSGRTRARSGWST